jgi:hypothetical protein
MRTLLTIAFGCASVVSVAQYTGGTGGGGATNCAAAFAMLPVELLHFTASVKDHEVHVQWATATEHNNASFAVERSADGLRFEAIAEVPGVGNSVLVVVYDALDRAPLPGTSYYRLLQTDFDGTTSYSDVVSVTVARSELSAYPNPADDQLWLAGTVAGEEITLLDGLGRTVGTTSAAEGSTALALFGLPAGRYTIRIVGNAGVRTLSLMKR